MTIKLTIQDIHAATARHFNIPAKMLIDVTTEWRFAHPRALAMYLCRQRTRRSFPEIAAHFHRDHTTAMSACHTARRLLESKKWQAHLFFIITRAQDIAVRRIADERANAARVAAGDVFVKPAVPKLRPKPVRLVWTAKPAPREYVKPQLLKPSFTPSRERLMAGR